MEKRHILIEFDEKDDDLHKRLSVAKAERRLTWKGLLASTLDNKVP